jgi:hypothetical protein
MSCDTQQMSIFSLQDTHSSIIDWALDSCRCTACCLHCLLLALLAACYTLALGTRRARVAGRPQGNRCDSECKLREEHLVCSDVQDNVQQGIWSAGQCYGAGVMLTHTT